MELASRLRELKTDWQLFWSALFDKKRVRSFETSHSSSESLGWLTQQRQRLNRRLEEIKEILESETHDTQFETHLLDEAQKLSEQISSISDRIRQSNNHNLTTAQISQKLIR